MWNKQVFMKFVAAIGVLLLSSGSLVLALNPDNQSAILSSTVARTLSAQPPNLAPSVEFQPDGSMIGRVRVTVHPPRPRPRPATPVMP